MLQTLEATTTPMARKKPRRKTNDRVAIIVLKDSYEYRHWFMGLTEATLIPASVIVRDALAKWAAERGLPPPPRGAVRLKGRPPRPRKPKGGGE